MNFAPKSEEKQKQSPSDAIFSLPNSKENKKNNKVINAVCAIFICLIKMKTKTEKVLSDDFIVCGFIVRHFFYCAIYVFCAIFDRHSRIKTKQIKKKVFFRLSCIMEGRWIFRRWSPNLNGGTRPSYNLSSDGHSGAVHQRALLAALLFRYR